MFDYGSFQFASKADLLERSAASWNPGKTRFWQDAGTPMVIDRREGYVMHDMSGKRLIDLHLNGGTYNFGHRHPELVAVLKSALDYFDMGNHWFPSVARTAFAENLVATAPHMKYAIFGAGGAEAVEIAIKTARYATKRKKIVSIIKGYHGHSGLSVATGDERFSKIFLCDRPEEFIQVPFNDVDALERVLRQGDVAAFIIETIPATYGFPLPAEGYLGACHDLCLRHGAKFIADEVQTGLMRTGTMWGWQGYGIEPDIFVTGKGLGGGIYPISACLTTEACGGWLHEDGAAHISTAGGAELGCLVGHRVIEMLQRPEIIANVGVVTDYFAGAMAAMMQRHSDIFVGVRQRGVVLGLEFDHPEGAAAVSRALYENGVWAIFSSLDKRVLQFKPGVLLDTDLCQEIMDRFDAAMPRARELMGSLRPAA
ncbi:aminotransferase class III-fold pyridoxal phosphate-dependent enzyme [Bosea sp. (in: a-proteobacteria)]|uniref:class-III pyridoxal-phosphate-dependent aminotransferase n=1 Tax=Bosea sp. (in: a-proteobacteria) TaxID=1871050 RepID=UPI0026364FA8|nr:aminotransferase class III-fold pyridoxal phosphate-dependent enzyme [Bosea sp. (in: a-proteobacteria)]MCO5093591.1 aminotransferase class III-fold pyridoxal phosphate-dependent enzyme [Bosea sp. (in: a-proteobacteria)]